VLSLTSLASLLLVNFHSGLEGGGGRASFNPYLAVVNEPAVVFPLDVLFFLLVWTASASRGLLLGVAAA